MITKIRYFLLIMFSVIFLLLFNELVFAGPGLSTSWGEVVIQNLKIGETYSVKQASNILFKVTNTGTTDGYVQIDVIPPYGPTKEGYEVIPSTSWITLDRYNFFIKSGESLETDVKISIPYDKQYLGKKYQVYLFSYTSEGAGAMGVGLKSRLLLHISEDIDRNVEESRINLNFKLYPKEIYLKDVEIARKYSLDELTKESLELTNLKNEEYTYTIKSVKIEEFGIKSPVGYEDCPDPYFLRFKKSKFTLRSQQSKKIQAYLKFPNDKKYKGKRYMFLIYAEVVGKKDIPGRYSRIYVITKE